MKQRLSIALSALMLAGLLVMPFSVAARGQAPGRTAASVRDTGETDAGGDVAAFRDRLAARSGPVAVFVELDAAPVAEAVARAEAAGMSPAAAATEGQSQLARIERAQRTTLSRIRAVDSTAVELFATQRVVNGFGMRVDAGALADILTVPGVRRVSRLPSYTRDNASSVPFIGAPRAWSGVGGAAGATGRGMKIGIIDTGIDYHHVTFGGPGNAYEANDPTIITDAPSVAFFGPNAPKVKGGYDFAGDEYTGDNDPAPDPDPVDCLDPAGEGGHGTHVAGTAAGFGVTSAGARYSGPYSTATDFAGFRVGPGVAPEADLYALRVFGCSGSTFLVIPAIEWSVDPNKDGDLSDRLDVVNLSLGSAFGRPDDPDAVAADNASKSGVVVVFSAGNEGNTTYVSGAPGSSDYAITVAASVDPVDIVDGFRVDSPAAIAGVKPATFSAAYAWATKPDVSGDLIYIPGTGTSTGCNVNGRSPYTAGQLAGKVLLVDWAPQGTSNFPCGSAQRANNAAAAGAAGIIMASGVNTFDTAITGNAAIPAVFTPYSVGAQLKGAAGTVRITFSNSFGEQTPFAPPELIDTLAGFTSRGPRGGDSALKPDIAAPGQGVFSAESLSGNDGVSMNGTSMAAPHITGVMALLRQLKPALSVSELKALAMNTAVNDLYGVANGQPPLQSVVRAGTGRVDVARAAAGTVIAYDTQRPALVSVSFGAVEVVSTTTLTRTVTVKNFGTAARTYTTGFTADTTIPGVSYAVSPASITVPAGGTTTLSVAMTADPAQMRHVRDPLLEPVQGNPPLPRHHLAEAAGTIDLYAPAPAGQPADVAAPELRLGVYATARPASTMSVAPESLGFGKNATGTAELTFSGVGRITGTALPTDVVSLATLFELQDVSGVHASGVAAEADLSHIGVASTFGGSTSVVSSTVFFGLASHKNWSTPNTTEFDVYIDTDNSGIEDDGTGAEYILFNWNTGSAANLDATDVFLTFLYDTATEDLTAVAPVNVVPASTADTQPFNTNVLVLPVPAADLGLTAAASKINYRVLGISAYAGGVEFSRQLSYDVAKPGVSFTSSAAIPGTPAVQDLPTTRVSVAFNKANFEANNSKGVLILHHHNTAGTHVEVVQVNPRLFLPLIGKR